MNGGDTTWEDGWYESQSRPTPPPLRHMRADGVVDRGTIVIPGWLLSIMSLSLVACGFGLGVIVA